MNRLTVWLRVRGRAELTGREEATATGRFPERVDSF